MFKHILLPTDGSPASERAIHECIPLAAETGARITGIHVHPPFHVFTTNADSLEWTSEKYEAEATKAGSKHLRKLQQAAAEANVPCETVEVSAEHPYEAIIQTAEQRQCDVIAMASRGHRGLKGLLLGSETQKVLTHAQKPVLVFH